MGDFLKETSMTRFLWAALFGLILGGCTADDAGRSSGGATTDRNTQDMKGSSDTAPGAEGDRRRPANTAPDTKY
jgi:hypothetical protein